MKGCRENLKTWHESSETHSQIFRARELQHAPQTIPNLESVKGCCENLKSYKLDMKAPKPNHKFLVHALQTITNLESVKGCREKGYLPNLLESVLLCQIFVF